MAPRAPKIPLPTDWPSHVKKGILHVIALARVALTAARASSKKKGLVARLHTKVEEQAEEISRLEEELRLKDRYATRNHFVSHMVRRVSASSRSRWSNSE